jgi:hypothetical protein
MDDFLGRAIGERFGPGNVDHVLCNGLEGLKPWTRTLTADRCASDF